MNFYESMFERYKNASRETRAAGLAYWKEKHAENIKAKNTDLIILSARMLSLIILSNPTNE